MKRQSPLILAALLLCGLVVSIQQSQAKGPVVKLGPVREQTIQFLMKNQHVDRSGAVRMIEDQERKGTKIIDSLSLPEGAMMTYVKVNGDGKPGVPEVENQGCGMVLSRDSEYGRKFWAQMERMKETNPTGYQNFMGSMDQARKNGYFVAKLTPQQEARLKGKAQAMKAKGTASNPRSVTTTFHRYLVVACTFPQWTDASPSRCENYGANFGDWHNDDASDPGVFYHHPIGTDPNASQFDSIITNSRYVTNVVGAGGPFLLNGTYQSTDSGCNSTGGRIGPLSPWSENHEALNPLTLTTDNLFQTTWFNLVFNTSAGAQSLYNFMFLNSHQQLAISGLLQDVKGWFRNHKHPLDGRHIGDMLPATRFLPFPGTPILVRPDPSVLAPLVLKGYSSSATSIAFYFNRDASGVGINVVKTKSDGLVMEGLPAGTRLTYDANRRVWVFHTTSLSTDPAVPSGGFIPLNRLEATFSQAVCPAGTPGRNGDDFSLAWSNPRGQSLTQLFNGASFTEAQLRVQSADVVKPRGLTVSTSHWIKSFDYYNHSHVWSEGTSTYQLNHLQSNSAGVAGGYLVDDLAGSAEHTSDRRDRPYPYDFSNSDLGAPNGGVFPAGNSTPGHTSGAWITDVNSLLNANGFTPSDLATYDRVLYLFPSGGGAGDEAGRSGSFIPVARGSTVVLPENAGLGLVAHELLHTYGAADLYDTDNYYNGGGRQPARSQSDGGIKNYSVMAGGIRMDPMTKMLCGWLTPTTTTSDVLTYRFPAVEESGANPVVLKIPIRLPQNVSIPPTETAERDPSDDNEYFLVENHNKNGGNLFGDSTSLGLTIWHVDWRAIRADSLAGGWSGHGMGDPNFLWIVPIQADGRYDIENGRSGDADDPFPGGKNIRFWSQTNPSGQLNGSNSRSRGITDWVSGQVIPGTDFDSYIRLLNIMVEGDNPVNPVRISGSVITTDVHVQPKEVIVTGASMAPPTVNQGQTNVAFMRLTFTNRSTGDAPPGISTGDVTINGIKFKQNGTSPNPTDVSRIALFDDSNNNGIFEPIDPDGPGAQTADALLSQVNNPYIAGGSATLSNLNYLVQLGAAKARNMFVVYDVSETAQTNPEISVGALIEVYTDVTPQPPGTVREGTRGNDTGNEGQLVTSDFPISSDASIIKPSGDTLTVTPSIPHPAPTSMPQGTLRQPMLKLRLTVNRDSTRIKNITVDQTGTAPVNDVVQTQVYEDTNGNGTFDDPNTGGADNLITNGSASFNTVVIGANTYKRATFTNVNYLISANNGKTVFVTYDISDFAQIPNQTVSANMADNTYITLVDPDDNVAPTNFPIDTGGTFITRASHQLVVTGRDIAPSYADPDVDPNADNTALARGHLIPIQDLNLAAAKGSIALNSLRVDLRGTSIAGVDIANNSAPATGGVRIYEDVNRNLTIDTGDLLVGHGNFSGTTVVASIDADPSTLAVDPFNITAGTTRDLIVAYDCAVAATVGRTMGSHLQNDATLQSADVSQIGYSQAEQDTVLFKNQGGATVTVLDSPLPIIRGFVKLDGVPSGIANVVIGSKRVATQRLVIQAIKNPSDVSDLVDKVVLQSLKVNKAGTSTASGDISEITLWKNDDGSTTFSGDETVLSAKDSTASGWPSSVTFDNLGLIIDNSQSATLLVTIDVPETATVGVTVGTQLLNSSFVNAGVSPNGVIVGSTAFPLTSSVMTIGGPIISSSISLAPDIYQVTFSGDMTPGTGPTGIENLSNWDFRSPSTVGANELPGMATKSVVYDAPSRTATLTTDPQTVGDDYQITVNNATDTNGHVIQSGFIIDGNNNVRRGNVTTGIVQTPQVQPDCQIVNSTDSPTATSFIGNNVYNATGTNQTKSQSMKPGDTAVYYVKVQNDAVFTDSIQVTGTAGTADFDVQYFDDGNVDITGVMTASGQTLTLVAGAFKIFRLEVTPQASAPDFGTPFTVLVRGVSTANDTKVDVVKASTSKIPNPLPDAQLSLNSAGPFLGNNLYSNSVSASQTLPVNTDQGATVTAYLRIQNDGVDPDSIRVTAIPTSTPSGWTVKYFDAVVAGTDRSAPILGTGFVVGPLNATQSQDLRVEITPDATVPIGEVLNADITATSGDGTKRDVVRVAVTNRPITKPDAHISNDNVTFVGNNIYNLTGVGQTVSLDRQNQVKAAYYLVLQNDGQNDDFLRLNAAGSGGGFTVQYFDAIGSEITTQVTGAGFTTVSLSQGASRTVRVEVTPDVGTASGTTRTINFTTTSVTGGRVDIARATINVLTLIKPDFEVFQPAPISGFTGLGVIENSPSATQTVTQSVLNRKTATYTFNLRNMGNVTDRFKLTAAPTSLPTGWTITVRSGATDVLNGGLLAPTGFVTPNVGITATYPLTITMTPGASIPASATVSMVFTAESTTDISKRDTSKAVATVPPNLQPDGSVKLSSQPDASLQGNDIYNQTGSGQTVVPPVSLDNNQKAVFVIRLENDGNKNDQFLVRVDQTISAPGWTISFFDTWNPANPTSGSNINSLVVSSDPSKTPVGWLSPAISPGAFRDIRCEVTPLNTTIGGDSLSIPVTLQSNTDSALSDVVMVEAFLNSINQPDAMMRLKTDATYQFDDIYDPTGANETISTMTLANGMKDFRVRVQNDGNMLDTYTVVGDPGGSGWSVKYFEYPSGKDITTDVLAGTYTLPDLAPKITRDLWFEVTPDSSVAAGDTKTVQLTVTSGNDNSEMDAVIASVLLNAPQSDMIVSGIGDDVYDTTTSTSQVSSQSVDAGVKATYPLRIQNDGNAGDSFKITGTAGTTGWVVKYFDAASGGTDITTKVTSTGGWVVTNLGGGQSKDFRVEVTPSSTLVGGVQQSLTVTGVSLADGTKKDIVRATTTVNTTVKPDLMVKKSTSSAYLTDNVYETTANPTTQVATQATAVGTAVTYNVRLQNDGNTTRTFLLRAAEDATSGWTVKYTSGSSDVTAQMLGVNGRTSAKLAPSGSEYLNITMTPTSSAADGSTKAVTITAYEDASNATILEAVAAGTTNTTTRIPDLKIRNYKESTYTDTARAQSVSGGAKATYEFRLQNIGNVTSNFVLNATTNTTGSTTGWTVKYFNGLTGGVDITAQITGGGYTVANLIKLGLKEFHIDVTPDTTVSANSTLTVDITAQNTLGTINTDTVSSTTTLVPTPAKPDMMIRGISDAAYVGNNVYNTSGASQTKSQSTTNGNTATYIVNLENDGNQVSTFTLTGPAGSSGWTFTYTLSDNTDITSQVTSAGGYTTAALAGGANQVFYVLVQPGVTVAGGSSRSILVTAASSTDATKKDTVMATTTVTIARQPDASIRNQGEATYTGEGSYDTSSGETQKKTQQITAGTIATYNAKVLNAGNVTENMRLKGTAGGSGWVVKYFNSLVGGTDITSSVTSSSGYTVSSLTTGSFREFRVEVTAGATLTIGAAKDVILTASSTTDGTKKDIVKASTSVNATRSRDRSATVASAVPASVVVVDNQPPSESGRPDVLIKKALDPDSEYRLDNVYQDTATGEQISVQMVPAGGSAAFAIKVENDGSSNRAFLVRAQESSEPGWKVLYKKEGLDLTELLVGEAGYITPELNPGESILLTVEMTPQSDTKAGTGKTTLITVTGGAVDSVIAGAIVTSKPGSSGDTTGEADVALAIFGASPNPVERGGSVTFSYVITNSGPKAQNELTLNLTWNGKSIAAPVKIPALQPGQRASGSQSVDAGGKSGSHFVTGEVSKGTGETNLDNNKQTVKLVVK